MGAAIWTFVNSPLGMLILTSLIGGGIFNRAVKSKSRRQKILEWAHLLFDVVERVGALQGLKGVQKYTEFLKRLREALAANNEKDLTPAEEAQMRVFAESKAWLAKEPR